MEELWFLVTASGREVLSLVTFPPGMFLVVIGKLGAR
jgi:hypothetical protein